MDAADVTFRAVTASGQHTYCYARGYYIARITPHGDVWVVDGPRFAPFSAPSEEEAREIVRMWARRR